MIRAINDKVDKETLMNSDLEDELATILLPDRDLNKERSYVARDPRNGRDHFIASCLNFQLRAINHSVSLIYTVFLFPFNVINALFIFVQRFASRHEKGQSETRGSHE